MTIKDAKLAIAFNSSAAVIGSLSSLAAVLVIIYTKAYSSYTYRIILYIAIASLLDRVTLGLEVLPANIDGNGNATVSVRDGWGSICEAIGFIDQYFSLCKPLAVLWLCLYVFVLATLRVQLHFIRHEVAGLLSVLLLPFLIVWVPLLDNRYGLTGTWCWIKDSCNETRLENSWYRLGTADIPTLLMHATSTLLVFATIVAFCKGSFTTSHLRHSQQTALKKILPLLLYPALYSVAVAASTAKDIYITVTKPKAGAVMFVAEMTVVILLQVFTLALPASLLLQSDVRRRMLCNGFFQQRFRKDNSVQLNSETDTAATAGVQSSARRHTEGTEDDPLMSNSLDDI